MIFSKLTISGNSVGQFILELYENLILRNNMEAPKKEAKKNDRSKKKQKYQQVVQYMYEGHTRK
jgi:hypothetical protein